MYQRVDECRKYFPRMHYVADMSKCNRLGPGVRTLFQKNAAEYDAIYLQKHFVVPKVLRTVYRLFVRVVPSYQNSLRSISDPYHAILELIVNQGDLVDLKAKHQEVKEEKLDRSYFDDFSKEELIEYAVAYQDQHLENKAEMNKSLESLTEIISQISWNRDFQYKKLPSRNISHPFHEIFQAVSLLQDDVGSMVDELTENNLNLEDQVNKRAQEIKITESNLRSMIQNYRSGIWMVDKEFRLMEYNSVFKAGAKLAYNIELYKGCPILELLPKEDAQLWRTRYLKAFEGNSNTYHHAQEVMGKMEYYDIVVYPIYVGESIEGVGVVTNDVSSIEESKAKLKTQNEELKKLNYELDTFMYRSTHDMRAPVATLMGLIDLAITEDDPKVKDDCLRFIARATKRMDQFIREIADITKNAKFDLEIQEINFESMIPELLEELAQSETHNRVKTNFKIEGSEILYSDNFRLKTILRNIISNAIKYADLEKDSYVEIEIQLLKGHASISIKDNGQGIREEDLEKVFNMFFRANDKSEGSGLGLFIVSELVEKIKAEIDLKSQFEKGTEVKLNIPSLKKP